MTVASRRCGPFRAAPRLPGDKSITHRAYLLGALAAGETRVAGANPGADCEATLAAVGGLGAGVVREPGRIRIAGVSGRFRDPGGPLDLGNSGTGLRLLLGVLAGQPFETVLTGDDSLRTRPVERVLAPLRAMGARASAPGDHPPVTLRGGALTGIAWTLPVPSAQVKSALLLAGIQASGETAVGGGGTSRDHTERLLAGFGAPVSVDPEADRVAVRGPAPLRGCGVEVPGDPSAGAFWLAAAGVVPGSDVSLEGMSLNPTRTGYLGILERMGLELETDPAGGALEPRGTVRTRGTGLRAVTVGPAEVPAVIDELPALAVAAAFAEGVSVFRGAGELRVKESDRLAAVAEGLAAIGAPVEPLPDGWRITGSGGAPLAGGRVRSRGDHRIAMAFLIAGLGCREGVAIADPPGIGTSDPHFISNLNRIMESSK